MKRYYAAALAAVLASTAWAQQPSARPESMTLTSPDGTAHTCTVIRKYTHSSGGAACEVRDQVTGEVMTVIENAGPSGIKDEIKKAGASVETVTTSADPILEPKAYSAPKVQEKYGATAAAGPAPAVREQPQYGTIPAPISAQPATQYNAPAPIPAQRRWLNFFRGDSAPKPMPVQTAKAKVPAHNGDVVALYHPDPVIRLVGSMTDDLLPSMREVSAETLARTSKDRPEVIEAMIRSVQTDPAASVRICCCRCLVQMQVRSPECVMALKSLEDDREENVRTAAAAAVELLDKP